MITLNQADIKEVSLKNEFKYAQVKMAVVKLKNRNKLDQINFIDSGKSDADENFHFPFLNV